MSRYVRLCPPKKSENGACVWKFGSVAPVSSCGRNLRLSGANKKLPGPIGSYRDLKNVKTASHDLLFCCPAICRPYPLTRHSLVYRAVRPIPSHYDLFRPKKCKKPICVILKSASRSLLPYDHTGKPGAKQKRTRANMMTHVNPFNLSSHSWSYLVLFGAVWLLFGPKIHFCADVE